MRTLRLTILLDGNISKATLANTFGNFTEINMSLNYLQFKFSHVKMLTALHLLPIYNLIENYEKQHQSLQFKMFHLYDETDGSYSPISLQCFKDNWTVVSSVSGVEVQSSANLLALI